MPLWPVVELGGATCKTCGYWELGVTCSRCGQPMPADVQSDKQVVCSTIMNKEES